MSNITNIHMKATWFGPQVKPLTRGSFGKVVCGMLVTVKNVLVDFGDSSFYCPSNLNSLSFTLFFPPIFI